MKQIRVGLVDDHPIVLEGLSQLLSLEPDIDIAFRASNGREAIQSLTGARVHVIVADVKMPEMDGIELLGAVRKVAPDVAIVLLTANITDAQVLEAVRLGVGGIVLKEAAPRALVQCVRAVAKGERWLDQRTVQNALESILEREAGLARVVRVLTKREIEIVKMVATGLRNREIGEKLHISEGTVKMHLHSIYEKLSISGRMELSIYARENQLA